MGTNAKKPRGKLSPCAFFVQACGEEHKNLHPDASIHCSGLLKKKECVYLGKRQMMPISRGEMRTSIPPKGRQKEIQGLPCSKEASSLFPRVAPSQRRAPSLSIGNTAERQDKQPNGKRLLQCKGACRVPHQEPDASTKGVEKRKRNKAKTMVRKRKVMM